ncbi:MAG TPA: hypothetical protein VNS79_01195 [Sphingobium sp.]|nr:hypothetical protein [Sphingobium sp.]
MTSAALIMGGVAAACAVGGGVVLSRPARSEPAVYARRLSATMLLALALILALFTWGLEQIGG